jgi:predicted DNA-binding protein YlxM (UPF0122 family)
MTRERGLRNRGEVKKDEREQIAREIEGGTSIPEVARSRGIREGAIQALHDQQRRVESHLAIVAPEVRAAIIAASKQTTLWDGYQAHRYSLSALADMFGLTKTKIEKIISEASR